MVTKKISLKKVKKPPLTRIPVNVIIPNLLTLIALCSGFTAVRFALIGQMELAVGAILVAALFDGLDGRIARLIGGASRFGAELDSLADFVSFGVAPALVIYFHALQDFGKIGWFATLFFTVCCALRLARFNTVSIEAAERKQTQPLWAQKYFLGVPAPAGAALAIIPLIVEFQLELAAPLPSVLYLFILIGIGLLLISKLHTFAFKAVHLDRNLILPIFVGVGIFMAGLLTNPWLTLLILGIFYLFSIPLSERRFRHLQKAEKSVSPPPL